jgi:hypothetical protein
MGRKCCVRTRALDGCEHIGVGCNADASTVSGRHVGPDTSPSVLLKSYKVVSLPVSLAARLSNTSVAHLSWARIPRAGTRRLVLLGSARLEALAR